MSIKKQLEEIFAKKKAEQTLMNLLKIIYRAGDEQLLLLNTLAKSLQEEEEGLLKLGEKNFETLSYLFGQIASLIEGLGSGTIKKGLIEGLMNDHRSFVGATAYLPKLFQQSPQVIGAIALMRRALRSRMHNCASTTINWEKRLGKIKTSTDTGGLLEKHPYLMPTAFCSNVSILRRELYLQFFGNLPGLGGSALMENVKILLKPSCEKWPINDFYAFSPLPLSQINDRGKKLWFEENTWSEQKDQLRCLQRQFPSVLVRFATLPELIYLDWCMRLSTRTSPMGIWSFRCEHPGEADKCLHYGGVSDTGPEISIEKGPEKRGHKALPLFILKTEAEKE